MSRVIIRALGLLAIAALLAGLAAAPPSVAFAAPPASANKILLAVAPSPRLAAETIVGRRPALFPTRRSSLRRAQAVVASKGAPVEAVVAPPFIAGAGPHMPGTLIAQTGRIDVYVGLYTFTPEQVEAIAPRIERLLLQNEARFGVTLERRVSLAFYRPTLAPSKDTRGIALTDEGRAQVFYRPHEDINRALVVASHELAHHLQAQHYGNAAQKRADIILLEGQATWITGPPWLGLSGASSWKERARQIRDMGIPLRLLTPQRYGSDIAYDIWASFVDFLIERDGMAKLHQAYLSGRSREPGSSDYEGVYGVSLDELADEWRAWVGN